MLSVLQKLGRAPFAPPRPAGDSDSPTAVVAAFPLRRLYEAALQFAFYPGPPGPGQEKFRIMARAGEHTSHFRRWNQRGETEL
jgi:hypothetical protein